MKFTESHEWIKVEEAVGVVGISDHAQHELGDVVYVEFPKVGQTVRKAEEIAVLESTKAAADIYSPVSGTVVAINESLKEQPELINQSPEDRGWIFKIELADLQELDSLYSPESYKELLHGRL